MGRSSNRNSRQFKLQELDLRQHPLQRKLCLPAYHRDSCHSVKLLGDLPQKARIGIMLLR